MKVLIGVIFFALYGLALNAQTLPTLYEVEGVPSGEFLNVREGPSVNADIVEVVSNSDRVEVLWEQGNWGFIGLGETSGWVSMSFLTAIPQVENETRLPLICFGTEPFWSIAVNHDTASYTTPEFPARPLIVQGNSPASNGLTFLFSDEDKSLTHVLVARANTCSDGMSDRIFGISAFMHMQTDEGNFVHHGCCTFQTE